MAYTTKAFHTYQYSFALTLFNSDVSTVDFQTQETVDLPSNNLVYKDIVRNRHLEDSNQNNVIISKKISRINDYKSPMILYITDITNYERGQPKLELNLDISSAFSETITRDVKFVNLYRSFHPNIIHLSFQTKKSLNLEHRKIEMPLPPIDKLIISFNLDRMMRR